MLNKVTLMSLSTQETKNIRVDLEPTSLTTGQSPMHTKNSLQRKTRLAQLIAETGSATEVARQAGTGRSYLSQIIGSKGKRNLGDLLAQRLEDAFGKPRGWMDSQESHSSDSGPIISDHAVWDDPSEFVKIPRLEVAASLGNGSITPEEDNIKGYLAFRNIWLQKRRLNPRFLTIIDAIGDSMQPTIHDGDVLLVDLRQKEPQDNGIFVLRLDNQLYAKRLHTRPGREIVVHSDNPASPPFPVALGRTQGVDIIGRVVWAGRDL